MTDERQGARRDGTPRPVVVVVMGVSGCGKSTVAELLAARLGGHFKDGDELHPASNIEKMSAGEPLTDDDRQPWLEAVRDHAADAAREHGLCVVACSALRRAYRETLRGADVPVFHVFLRGSRELIASRMSERKGHFMPFEMLDGQIATLESPETEARVVTVDVSPPPADVARAAEFALRALDDFPHVTPEPDR